MRNTWLFGLAAVALPAALYLAFRPDPAPPATPAVESVALAVKANAAPDRGAPLRQEFALLVAEGRVASGPPALHVLAGTEVTIRIQSDRSDELHVHGYDLSLPLAPGQPSTLTFLADRTGRFALELHESQLEVGAIEVMP